MSGMYPDPPAERMAYDRDGTIGFWTPNGVTANTIDANNMERANDENMTGATGYYSQLGGCSFFGFLFPELRDVAAVYAALLAGFTQIEVSADTTDGINGSWTPVSFGGGPIDGTLGAPPQSAYREHLITLDAGDAAGAKAIRFIVGGANEKLYALHLYGARSADSDRLEFWHPTLDQPLGDTPALLDFGDIEQGETYTKTVRVKNLSATLDATDVTVSIDAPTDDVTTPNVDQYDMKLGAGAYGTEVTIASLAAGAISSVITLRRQTDPAAALGPWAQRLHATAASWA